jgi:hypothetical protein
MRVLTITRRSGAQFEVLLDAADYDRVVAAGPWSICTPKDSRTAYVMSNVRVDGRKTGRMLHRFLLDAAKGREVDHIDGDGLNNTRGNLRLASRSENMRNIRRITSNTSGFKGVSWHKRNKCWDARIMLHGKPICLGSFTTPEAAHAAYCSAAASVHGEFARTA